MIRRCRPLLGTFVEIACEDAAAIEAGFAAIEHVHRLMSAHEPDSELSLINREGHLGWVELDEQTAAVLARAIMWSRASNGQFDIVRAGRSALYRGALPQHLGQPIPHPESDWTDIAIEGHAVRLHRPACLDFGGIAKGFAVDRAVETMIAAGALRGLVNAGGDIRGFGTSSWPISIVEPHSRQALATVDLRDAALATSAGLPTDSGLAFSHLLEATDRWVSITVKAASCCDADAMTKILWTGWAGAPRLLAESGASAFAVGRDGRVHEILEEALA